MSADRVCVSHNTRLSESILWPLMEAYYDQESIGAWEEQIPFYPTSNAFLGSIYADLILNALADQRDLLSSQEPVYLLELAAGSGTLGFYVLKALAEKHTRLPSLKNIKFCYVLTDFTENLVTFWEQHPKLKPYFEAGLLDAAVFRPEDQESLCLRWSKKTLGQGQLKNPVVALANYCFDTLKHDLFCVEGGQLAEIRLDFYAPAHLGKTPETLRIADLSREERALPIVLPYYQDAVLDGILADYARAYPEASFIFPIGAFRTLQNLQCLSDNRVILLATDKGFVSPDLIRGKRQHHYGIHGGAMSFMVNFDALQRYAAAQHGQMWVTADNTLFLETAMGVLWPEAESRCERAEYTFGQVLSDQNAINSLYHAQTLLKGQLNEPGAEILKSCIGMLKLCHWDPLVFNLCKDKILEHASTVEWTFQQQDIVQVLKRVEANLFFPSEATEAMFYKWFGMVFLELAAYEDCKAAFQHYMYILGRDDSLAFCYIAVSHEGLGQYAQALDYYQKALALEPQHPLALAGVERVQPQVC